jgi:hypothetical protein
VGSAALAFLGFAALAYALFGSGLSTKAVLTFMGAPAVGEQVLNKEATDG